MSFYVEFTGRSRTHALQLLETRKASLPAVVVDFIGVALKSMPKPPDFNQQIIAVKAQGHLMSNGDFTLQLLEIKPTLIPD
ncbi:hypothetical protein [Bradyrhizobium sp. LA2.1]|uniref:hypothetical protein n=1 Tax=Bradyrhizobium sp. LA2.1 TaxID=3156376 RepID=UPI0033965B97